MSKINKYIEFTPNIQKNKTKIWTVTNIESGYKLGYIHWYHFWRQYCFFPEPKIVFSSGCLQEIIQFIQDHKNDRIEVEQK
jgi:hypothetical protein